MKHRFPTFSTWMATGALSLAGLFGPASSSTLHAGEPTLSEAERKVGWTYLFDGTSADKWRNYKKDSLSDAWQVKDGVLTRTGKNAGDIVTKEKFGYFELLLEYRITPKGNSGLMFMVTEDGDAPWYSGPEVQIQDNKGGRDPQKAGWLYQLYSAGHDTTRPPGEWNQMQLLVSKGRAELYMNGFHYWTAKIGTPEWEQKIAKSKFKQFANFGKATEGHICLQDHGDEVSFRNIKIRKLPADGSFPDPVDGKLNVGMEPAFPDIKWANWDAVDEKGKVQPLRPIVLTSPNDGTNRFVVATQQGVIHIFPNDPKVKESKILLDITSKVRYADQENEEGFLGLAFHPDYKTKGEFFVYYTSRSKPHLCKVSRFKVSKDNADKADPEEEVLMEFDHPYWNHKGGTLAFGPDGYLYIVLGDGGAANDPHDNGQNLNTHLGKLLRIDINSKADGKNYAVPKDNPFVGKENAKPEIFAYGLRNVWRFAFDRKTGALFAADVGQNLFEEVNIITKGGNYGWNFRESYHAFGKKSPPEGATFIDPIWEYDHQVGKSITGGVVYRGKAIPELAGKYLHADYVSGKVWALDYDQAANKVKGNYSIPSPMLPTITFGEDDAGEAYFSIVSGDGKGIFRLVPGK